MYVLSVGRGVSKIIKKGSETKRTKEGTTTTKKEGIHACDGDLSRPATIEHHLLCFLHLLNMSVRISVEYDPDSASGCVRVSECVGEKRRRIKEVGGEKEEKDMVEVAQVRHREGDGEG